MSKPAALPRIEYLKVRNFRALRDVEFDNLMPLTVLLGPNGSGKSTVFDVFAFLAEAFELGLRRAWDKRGRARELCTSDSSSPVVVEIKYREPGPDNPLITYHLAIDERGNAPVVAEEWLSWRRPGLRYDRLFEAAGRFPAADRASGACWTRRAPEARRCRE